MFLEVSEGKYIVIEKVCREILYELFYKDCWELDKQRRVGREFELGKENDQGVVVESKGVFEREKNSLFGEEVQGGVYKRRMQKISFRDIVLGSENLQKFLGEREMMIIEFL